MLAARQLLFIAGKTKSGDFSEGAEGEGSMESLFSQRSPAAALALGDDDVSDDRTFVANSNHVVFL